MLKNIIAPVQAWLLSQNRCVGCGTPLVQGVKSKTKMGVVVVCKCKRAYIYDDEKKRYRRALLSEV
jgi:hypothetical protein